MTHLAQLYASRKSHASQAHRLFAQVMPNAQGIYAKYCAIALAIALALALGLGLLASSTQAQGLPLPGTGGCGINMSCVPPVGGGGAGGSCSPPAGGNPNGADTACGGSSSPATQGNTSATNQGAGNPIHLVSGNKYQTEIDMPALPGILGLELVRHYNSQYSKPHVATAALGRGWKLSYESELFDIGATLQIVQADGSRIIFNKDAHNPSLCASANPAQGQLLVQGSGESLSYLWRWVSGRELLFNAQGKLVQIAAPSGEFVSLQHDSAGLLVRVTDPQGRSLQLQYANKNSTGFAGIARITTPAGVFAYRYGSPLPETASRQDAEIALANLVQVHNPAGVVRRYHYEDAAWPTLLTGISVQTTPQPADGSAQDRAKADADTATTNDFTRLSTYAYNERGRAVLSVRGSADSLRDRVELNSDTPGLTIITNAQGQTTSVRHAMVQGEWRLLEVRGAGCAQCGPANVRYTYDALGRLIARTTLNTQGKPVQSTHFELDGYGRRLRTGVQVHGAGATQAATKAPITPIAWQERFAYAPDQFAPVLIAKPSVVRGKEHITAIRYNQYGQPLEITETGYSPLDAAGQLAASTLQAQPIARSTQYQYATINGRSVLVAMDGPLPNGALATPQDSDITTLQWDSKGSHIVAMTQPGALRQSFEYDADTGRLLKRRSPSGLLTQFSYDTQGNITQRSHYPARFASAQAAQEAALLLSTTIAYDAFNRITSITRPDGQSIHMSFDAQGNLTQLSDGLGNRIEWKDWKAATAMGENHPSTNPEQPERAAIRTQQWFSADAPEQVARAWYFWYDPAGRLVQRLAPDSGVDQWLYSTDIARAGSANLGNAANAANSAEWAAHSDVLNRVSLQMALPRSALPQLAASAQPTAADQRQWLDDFGRVVQFSSAPHGRQIAHYDAANRISRLVQSDAIVIDYRYNTAGQLQQKSTADNPPIEYDYSPSGLVAVRDAVQTSTYAYDDLERPIAKTVRFTDANAPQHSFTLRTRFDAQGRISAQQLANTNWLRYSYNPSTGLTQGITLHVTWWPALTNRLAQWFNAPDLPLMLASRSTVLSDIQTHAFNGVTQYTHGNGVQSKAEFDAAGRLVQLNDAGVFKANYRYDLAQRLVAQEVQNAEAQSAPASGLDGANAAPPMRQQATFSYQGSGALVRPEAMRQADAAQYEQYDRSGRMLQDARFNYQYDAWGKLQSATLRQQATAANTVNTAATAYYAHNAQGERVLASYRLPGQSTELRRYYLYHQGQRVAELDAQGNVLQQYLYLNGRPVAVLSAAPNSSSKPTVIALHTDRRGAPVAATNAQQHMVWQASYNAWGQAQVQNGGFALDLRLPGQWQDPLTQLYYNYQRDYNPQTGRYLTPDPLGFPDGPDAYLYVNGDPVNKVDPLGLYQKDIHFYMNFFLALVAGIDYADARTIALAAQYIDENDDTRPLKLATGHQTRLKYYHFTLWDGDDANPVFQTSTEINNPSSAQLDRLEKYANEANQNTCASRFQFFGEYLHTLADRDDPYIQERAWFNREARTLEMEKEVFAKMKAFDGKGAGLQESDIVDILVAFNQTRENDEGGEKGMDKKLQILSDALKKFGIKAPDGSDIDFNKVATNPGEINYQWNKGEAAANRVNNLKDNDGNPLKQENFPGAILPSAPKT